MHPAADATDMGYRGATMPDPITDDSRDPNEPREEETHRADPAGENGTEEPDEHPRGTLFLMLIFLMVLVALWGYVYFDMIRMSS